jgi:hypothetical protein
MKENSEDMVKKVFLEEHYPDLKDPTSHALMNEFFEEEISKEDILKNIKEFWKLPPLKQKQYVKNYPLVLERIGLENFFLQVEKLYVNDQNLLEDNTELVKIMIKNIEQIFKSIKNSEQLCQDEQISLKTQVQILKFLESLLESKNTSLLLASRKAILSNAEYISDSVYNNELLSMILNLLHDPVKEQNRISALRIIAQLYQRFDIQNIQGFIAIDIISLVHDLNVNVRLEAYRTFFLIFSAFKIQFLEKKFLDIIEKMNENNNNNIRLIFINNVALMSEKLPFAKFESKILNKFIGNLTSKNRFIKEEALLNIGKLIVSLLNKTNTEEIMLVSHSTSFNQLYNTYFEIPKLISKLNLHSKKNILKSNFKYLKQVIIIKDDNLWNKLKGLFKEVESLQNIIVESAKMIISIQLDKIAKVIPKKDLGEFIKIIDKNYLTIGPTTSEKVKQNTIKVLAGVLKELNIEEREKYADVYYTAMSSDINKWRFRFVISEQIDELAIIFSPLTVVSKLLPLFFSFCKDNCSVVRKFASQNLWKLLNNVNKDKLTTEIIIENMKGFGSYKRFSLRQSFVYMIEGILNNVPEYMNDELISILKNLAGDDVVNIRITIANMLLKLKDNKKCFEWEDDVFNSLISHQDHDLISILSQAYSADPKKSKILDNVMNKIIKEKKKEIEEEKSFIEKIRSESEDSLNTSMDFSNLSNQPNLSTNLNIKNNSITSIKNNRSYQEDVAKFYSESIKNTLNQVLKNE